MISHRTVLAVVLLLLAGPALAQARSAAERAQIIERVAGLLEDRYVYPDRGKELASALRRDVAGDRWSASATPQAFAQSVTERLRELSDDGHLRLDFSSRPLPENDAGIKDHDAAEMDRWYGPKVNHGFESVARLEQGIGYLDLRVFAPVDMAGDMAQSAMTLLAQSPALIIDLRNNGGGMDEMVALLAGYLFDAPRQLSGKYDRPSNKLIPMSTPASVPGRRFGGRKPLYILISPKTFSAAEAFAYDLQALGRATIVGQPSGGGAHPFEYRRVDRHFVLSLPEGRSINPITGTDWEGRGVTPDVPASADRALDVALALAKDALARTPGK